MLLINALAEHPGAAQPLSDLSRETGIHKATAAAVLGTLVKHGLVRRTDRKSYLIGPEFVRLNFAYTERHISYHFARAEIGRLSDKLNLSCSVSVPDGDEFVILDIAGELRPPHLPTRLGRRIPLVPPVGTVFKAWAEPAEVNDWIKRMTDEFEIDEESQRAAISAIRIRGYSLGSEQDFDVHLDAALKRLAREGSDVRSLTVAMMVADKIRNYAGTGEEHGSDEPVNYIVGPVFGPDERVIMSLNLFGAPGQIRRRDVDGYAAELLKSTARVTAAVRGVAPSALANVALDRIRRPA